MTDAKPTEKQMRDDRARLAHAALDRSSRTKKARKIIALIGPARLEKAHRILEIGCGSGVIASTLSHHGHDGLEVHAVDVADNRIDRSGYSFQQVGGTALPFEAGYFDIVISNHVIEHVGPLPHQREHVAEINRVLSPGGLVYLAVPNKWRLVEPHFRLPFLSWLPSSLSDRYVRLMKRGTHYDCFPPSFRQAMDLFNAAGFTAVDVTIQALRETLAIEFPANAVARVVNRFLPDWVLRIGMGVMPTYVFLLRDGSRCKDRPASCK